MKQLVPNEALFEFAINKLVIESSANPIYHFNHREYYQSISKQSINKDYSVIIVDTHGEPIVGILAHEYLDSTTNKSKLSYLGQHGLLMWDDKFEQHVLNKAMKYLSDFCASQGLLKLLQTSDFIFKIYGAFIKNFDTILIDKLLGQANKSYLEYEKVVDVNQNYETLVSGLSKSVRAALRKEHLLKTEIRISSENDHVQYVDELFENLKKLHFNSAGRLTRSLESWEIQRKQVGLGTSIVINGFIESKLVHASLFLLSGTKAFYGVSANNYDEEYSISHAFIFKTFLHLKSLNTQKIYMGKQYENLNVELEEKVINISKFKSFFGGVLVPSIVLYKGN